MVPKCFLCHRYVSRRDYSAHLEKHAYNRRILFNPMIVPPLPDEKKIMIEHGDCCFNGPPNRFCRNLELHLGKPGHHVHQYVNFCKQVHENTVAELMENEYKNYHIKRIGSDTYAPLILLNNFIENHQRFEERDQGYVLDHFMRRHPYVKGRFAWGFTVYEVGRPNYDDTGNVYFHADHHDILKQQKIEDRKMFEKPVTK